MDPRELTPGCRFTSEVENALNYYILNLMKKNSFKNVEFYVSGMNVMGEGEIKIIKHIQSMSRETQNEDKFTLVGSDADLVLLAMASRVSRITILNYSRSTLKYHQPLKKGLVLIAIDLLSLKQQFSEMFPSSQVENICTDFVMLSIISGNDYIPKIPYSKIDLLYENYVNLKRNQFQSQNLFDPISKTVNLNFLKQLLGFFSKEKLRQTPIHFERRLKKTRILVSKIENGELDKQEIINKYTLEIIPPIEGFVPRDPIEVFLDLNTRDTWDEYDSSDHCYQFIYGIEWVMRSYLNGQEISFDWFFPYSSAPNPIQLINWIENSENLKKYVSPNTVPIDKELQPWMFAMLLIDASLENLIAPCLKKFMLPTSSIYEIYDTTRFYSFIDVTKVLSTLKNEKIKFGYKESKYSLRGFVKFYKESESLQVVKDIEI